MSDEWLEELSKEPEPWSVGKQSLVAATLVVLGLVAAVLAPMLVVADTYGLIPSWALVLLSAVGLALVAAGARWFTQIGQQRRTSNQ